jgi:hypothetical protein
MNIRTIAASALVLATLASGALAGTSNFISAPGVGQSDDEANFAIGHSEKQNSFALQATGKVQTIVKTKLGTGDYIGESNVEANQRSSNR